MIRGLCCPAKKTFAGNVENTLDRSRIVEAPKQQWPDHDLAFDGDCKRDCFRKMRAYVQRGTDEWEPEMHSNETPTESDWNANESRDAWGQASWDEAGSWKLKTISSKEASRMKTKKGIQSGWYPMNEALACERNVRRTVAQTRATMHDIKSGRGGCHPRGASKEGSGAGKSKSKKTK